MIWVFVHYKHNLDKEVYKLENQYNTMRYERSNMEENHRMNCEALANMKKNNNVLMKNTLEFKHK